VVASAVFDLCDRYVTGLAALDPVWATMCGVTGAPGGPLAGELAAEADRVRPGASAAEAAALLDETDVVTGADAYRSGRSSWTASPPHCAPLPEPATA
jgi:hypothetical protein